MAQDNQIYLPEQRVARGRAGYRDPEGRVQVVDAEGKARPANDAPAAPASRSKPAK